MDDSPINLLQLHAARIGKERSSALPARCYRNPADSFEYPQEVARQQKAAKLKRKQGK